MEHQGDTLMKGRGELENVPFPFLSLSLCQHPSWVTLLGLEKNKKEVPGERQGQLLVLCASFVQQIPFWPLCGPRVVLDVGRPVQH